MPVSNQESYSLSQRQLESSSRQISWSKNGFICYATPASSGFNLNMTFLENTNGSNWQLAEPHKLAIKPSENGALPDLQVISWSTVSTDLAVFDEHGNFYVLLAGVGLLRSKDAKTDSKAFDKTTGQGNGAPMSVANSSDNDNTEGPSYELTSYNHAEMIYRDIVPPGSAKGGQWRCAAFEWLGLDKPQIINKPALASENNGSYTYGVHSFQSSLIAHPIVTKQACVALRHNGVFSLYHQGEHKVEYHKLSLNLTPSGGEEVINYTHASVGFTSEKKILICAYDAISNRVLTFLVSVDWGFLKDSATKQKADPHYYTPKDKQTPPGIQAELVHEMLPMPIQTAINSYENEFQAEESRLSSIEVLSPNYSEHSALEILITYNTVSHDSSISSTIQRFQLKEANQILNSHFSAMSNASNMKGASSTLVLQDKYSLPYKLKAIQVLIAGSVILFIGEDSSVVAINRADWSLIESPNDVQVKAEHIPEPQAQARPATINSLLDCGFTFPSLHKSKVPFLYTISPNLTGVVHVTLREGEPATFTPLKRQSSHLDGRLLSAAFAHTHAQACYSNTSSDDLMALILTEYNKVDDPQKREQLIHDVIVDSHSAINFILNSFNKESVDKLLSNPPLQKLLSLQLSMSDLSQNKAAGDIAWIVLGLRSTSFGIMFSLSSIYRQMSKKSVIEDTMEDSINRAECVISLVGSVKWFIDLLIYLNQELLQLASTKSNPGVSLVTPENSIALPILMSKVPRLFLMYAITSIGKTHDILKKLHKDLSESNKLFTPMKEALERFFNTSNYSPLKLSNFETFLRDCDEFINKEVSSKGFERSTLLYLEQSLFCDAKIPRELLQLATAIVDKFTANNNRDPRLSSLFFYDSRWVGVGVTRKEQNHGKSLSNGHFDPTQVRLQQSKTEAIDALRKVYISCSSPITSGGTLMGQYYNSSYRLKKCVRCRSVSLVSDPLVFDSPKAIGLWTMVFQRNCVCGSAWVNCVTSETKK